MLKSLVPHFYPKMHLDDYRRPLFRNPPSLQDPDKLQIKNAQPFNSPLSGTTRVSWYQKGKTNLDFIEARDSEWQWHQLGRMQVCTLLQTENHTSTPPLAFLQAGCPSCRPTNSIKALKATNKSRRKTIMLQSTYPINL